MARNVEVKARIESVEALAPRVAALADSGPSEILHEDTFFACASGRLKLRMAATMPDSARDRDRGLAAEPGGPVNLYH